jgi:hypothetical protein
MIHKKKSTPLSIWETLTPENSIINFFIKRGIFDRNPENARTHTGSNTRLPKLKGVWIFFCES